MSDKENIAVTVVPYDALDRDTLRTLITEFIVREGTDYGNVEVTLALKIEQIMRQLHTGSIVITYCTKSESTTLIPARQLLTKTNVDHVRNSL